MPHECTQGATIRQLEVDLAVAKSDISTVKNDISDMKDDVKDVKNSINSQKWWLIGILGTVVVELGRSLIK